MALAGSIAVPAAAAHALPDHCTTQRIQWSWQVYCDGGTGEFRARAYCVNLFNGSVRVVYGQWRWTNGGVRSIADCKSATEDVGTASWYDLRG